MPLCTADCCSERLEHKHFQMIPATQELSLSRHLLTTINHPRVKPTSLVFPNASEGCKKNPPKPTEFPHLCWKVPRTRCRQNSDLSKRNSWQHLAAVGCHPLLCLCHMQAAEGQERLNLTRSSHNRVNIDILLTQTPPGRQGQREHIPGLPGQVFSEFSFQTLLLISSTPLQLLHPI